MVPLSHLLLAVAATPQSQPPDLQNVDLDSLIAMLPPAGCETSANAELRRRLANGLKMSDEQWRRALLGSESIRFRSKWPSDLPLALSVREPRWTIESGVEIGGTNVYATPRTPGLKSIEGGELMHLGCGNLEIARRELAEYQEIGRLGLGRHRIVFDVSVETQPSAVRWGGSVEIDVEIVPALDQALPAADSPELRELVRGSLCRFPPSRDAIDPPASVVVAFIAEEQEAPTLAKLAGTAFTLEIALYEKGVFVSSGSTRVSQAGGFRPCQEPKSRWTADGVVLGPIRPPASGGTDPFAGLEVRVRGIPKDVLRHWGAEAWWNGTVSIPLKDLPVHR